MKTTNLKKFIVGIFTLTILALGTSCEVYEIVNTVDTIFVDRPVQGLAPSFITVRDTVVIRDTVSTTIVIRDTLVNNIHTTDTIFQVVTKDSVIVRVVEKVVNHTDTVVVTVHDTIYQDVHHYDTIVKNVIQHDTVTLTVYDRTVMYLDTLYVTYDMWPTTSMPEEIAPLYADFNEIAFNHGKGPLDGHIIIQYVQQSELPGENWNSNSFKFANNHIIYLNVNLPTEQQRAGMYRELNHLNYGKQYSNDVNKVMSPIFDPARTITTQQLNQMFQ